MNYCTSCLRELNGVLSCPGCGASVDSIPSAQNSTSVVWMRQPAGGRQDPLPTPAKHGAQATAPAGTAADRSSAKARARAHAAPSSIVFGGSTSAEPEFFQDSDSAGGTRYGNRGRHSHRRRSLARRVTATGGFAGIAVIGSLALSNLSTPSSGNAAAAGSVAVASTLAQPSSQSATASSDTTSGTRMQTPTSSNSGSSSATARNSTPTSTSATSQSSMDCDG